MTHTNYHYRGVRVTFLLMFLNCIGPLTVEFLLPGVMRIAHFFEVSLQQAQTVIVIYSVGIALGQLFWGWLADRWGRFPVALLGLCGYLAGSFFCLIANQFDWLLAGRLAQAMGASALVLIVRIIATELNASKAAFQQLNTVTLTMLLWLSMASVVGSYVTEMLGFRAVFFVMTCYGFLGIILVIALFPKLKTPHGHALVGPAFAWPAIKPFLLSRAFIGNVICLLICSVLFSMFMVMSPLIFERFYAVSGTEFGWILLPVVLGFCLGSLVAQTWTQDQPMSPLLRWSPRVTVILATVWTLAQALEGVLPLSILLILVGLCNLSLGLIYGYILSQALGVFHNHLGLAAGWVGFIQFAGSALFYWILMQWGFTHSLLPMAITELCLSILLWRLMEWLRNK